MVIAGLAPDEPNKKPLHIQTVPLTPPELNASVTDISWSVFGDPLDSFSASFSSSNNNNHGSASAGGNGGTAAAVGTVSPRKTTMPSPAEHSVNEMENAALMTNHSNSVSNAPPLSSSTSAIRARKRSSNERDELASASIILPNSGVAVPPRPLSMEQQKR